MKLSEIGEFGLIERFSPPFIKGLDKGAVGIGDDCAVIPWGTDLSLLVTTDMLIEEIHFLRNRIEPQDLGHKSLAVNLSDIAAMGGTPLSAFLSLGIPREMEVEWLDEFFLGLRGLAATWKVQLLGGDTTRSPGPFVINVTVLGQALTKQLKYRSSARKGDIIAVTGFLGDSAGGLTILREERIRDEDADYLIREHHRPAPQLMEGAWLAAHEGVNALMDVSDGIDSDLQRIMERSQCGVSVELANLPISAILRRTSDRYGWRLLELAAAGGEDYCLLTSIAPAHFTALKEGFEKRFKRPLFCIGAITGKEEGLAYYHSGRPVRLGKAGFDHFSHI